MNGNRGRVADPGCRIRRLSTVESVGAVGDGRGIAWDWLPIGNGGGGGSAHEGGDGKTEDEF